MSQNKDLRKNRSRQAIKTAFVSLLNRQPFQSITIQNILDRSGYSRGTFYAYFLDKYDLADKLLSDETDYLRDLTFSLLQGEHGSTEKSDISQYIFQSVYKFFEHVYENQNLYRLFADETIPGITLNEFAKQHIQNSSNLYDLSFAPPFDNIDANLYAFMSAHIYAHLIDWWITNDFEQSPKFMARHAMLFFDPPNMEYTVSISE